MAKLYAERDEGFLGPVILTLPRSQELKEIRIFFQKQSYKAQEAVVDEFYDKLFVVFLLFYTQQN